MAKEALKQAIQESPFAAIGVILPVIVAAGWVVIDKLTGKSTNVSQVIKDLIAVEGLLTIPLGLVSDVARETIQAARVQGRKP